MSIATALTELLAEGKKLYEKDLAAQTEQAKQAELDRMAEIDEAWKPILDAVRVAVPSDLHCYLEWSSEQEPSYYAFAPHYDNLHRTVRLRLPDAAPIEIFCAKFDFDLAYRVAEPVLKPTDDGWIVEFDLWYSSENQYSFPITDLSVAVFLATEEGKSIPALRDEAEGRNRTARAEQAAKAAAEQAAAKSVSAADLAMNHVDTMFHFFALRGHFIGLDKIAKGAGLSGKTEGMSGALAPQMWANGEYEKVLEYVAQDVRTTLDVALAVEAQGCVRWISNSGRPNRVPLSRWLTVAEAMLLPEPDQSWMTDPVNRSKFIEWMQWPPTRL